MHQNVHTKHSVLQRQMNTCHTSFRERERDTETETERQKEVGGEREREGERERTDRCDRY